MTAQRVTRYTTAVGEQFRASSEASGFRALPTQQNEPLCVMSLSRLNNNQIQSVGLRMAPYGTTVESGPSSADAEAGRISFKSPDRLLRDDPLDG